MRISHDNLLLKTGSTISSTFENSNFPVTNVLSNYLELPFKSTVPDPNITITFSTDYDIDHFCIGYHNMAGFTITFYDAIDSIITSTLYSPNQNRPIDFYYVDVLNVRKIIISIVATDATLYLGGFSVGKYFQFPDFQATPETPYSIRGNASTNGSNQVSGNVIANSRSYIFNFKYMEESSYLELEEVFNRLGICKAHFVDIYQDNLTTKLFRPIWGVIDSRSDSARKEYDNENSMYISITYRSVN